jgi:hypothetical protein
MATFIVRFRDDRPPERVVADHHTVEGEEATGSHVFSNRSPNDRSHSHVGTLVASYPRGSVLAVDDEGLASVTP